MAIFAKPIETRGWRFTVTNPRSPAYWVSKLFGAGQTSASGIVVNAETALTIGAVFSACRILAEDVGTLPFNVFEKLAPTGRRAATENPADRILSRQANPEMSAISLKEALQGHAALRGNGYAEIERDQGMRPKALWPLRPDKMTLGRNGRNGVAITGLPDGQLAYVYSLPNGQSKAFLPQDIFHLKGFGGDGLQGYSVVTLAREAFGLALATEQFGGRFFGNDARPGVVLQHPGKLSDTAQKNLAASWDETHRGLSNAQRVAILEEGITLKEVGIPPEDAQFLQTRGFQVSETARWFRIAPHLLQDLSQSTNNNIEHQGLEHVIYTLRAWGERWEAEGDIKLVAEPFFTRINFNAFLRGDTTARFDAYMKAFGIGAMNGDMIAELEDRNPLPDHQGEAFYVPANMIPTRAFDEKTGLTLAQRSHAALELLKAGYEADAVNELLNLGDLAHTGFVPGTTTPSPDEANP